MCITLFVQNIKLGTVLILIACDMNSYKNQVYNYEKLWTDNTQLFGIHIY